MLQQKIAKSKNLTKELATSGIRAVLLALGLLVFTLPLVAPALRRSDGWLMPLGWTLAVGGISLTVLGAAWRTRWQRCAGLLALALVGQACALSLIDAPPYGVLQHYLPWGELLGSPKGFLLLGPLCQTVIILGMAWQSRRAVETWLRRLLLVPQALILVGVMTFAAAYGSWSILRYAGEVALSGWVLLINLLNLIMLVASLPVDFLTRQACWLSVHVTSRTHERSPADQRAILIPWCASVWVVLVSALLSSSVFERVPHIPDAVMYLFQAKYFAYGHLYLPSPPDASAFEVPITINDGEKWYGIGQPGWPAILAIGVRLGVPWLVNPVLGGLTVLLVYALVRRLYDRKVAHAAVLLVAVSPWFLFMSASFMTHPLTVAWTLGSLVAIQISSDTKSTLWGALSGACLGGLLLTRPFEGVLLSVPIGLWAMGLETARIPRRSVMAFGLAVVLVGGLNLPYNWALTGRPTYFPITKYTDEAWYRGANRLGFGQDVGNFGWNHLDPLPGHGLLDVLINANQNLYMTNVELFGWGFGSLGLALLLVVWRRWTRADWLMLSMIVAIIGGYSFYWFSGGPDFGARYWYLILIPLVVLTVRGIQELQRRWEEGGGNPLGVLRIGAFVVAASLVALINYLPWRSLDKYHHYRGMNADMARLDKAHKFGHSLVFVREGSKYDYARGVVFNPPTLDSPGTIYVRDLGPANRLTVARRFPDRQSWIVAGSRVPAAPFTLGAGPLPPLATGAGQTSLSNDNTQGNQLEKR